VGGVVEAVGPGAVLAHLVASESVGVGEGACTAQTHALRD
jgi:hypothetical protein